MANIGTRPDNLTYDVIAAFVRQSVIVGGKVPAGWINEVLPIRQLNFCGTEVLKAIKIIANKLLLRTEDVRTKIILERTNEIAIFNDLSTHFTDVKEAFHDIMKSWLIYDKHTMTWERVITVISMTAAFVDQIILKHNDKSSPKIRDLVSVATHFIDVYMFEWIKQQGRWDGLLRVKDAVFHQQTFDIPQTSRLQTRPKETDLEQVKKKPTAVTSTYVTPDGVIIPTYPVDIIDQSVDDLRVKLGKMKPFSAPSRDVIVAFMLIHLTDRYKANEELSKILEQGHYLFKWTEKDCLDSEVVAAILDFDDILVKKVQREYNKIWADHTRSIGLILNPNSANFDVWQAFTNLLYSWFIQDGNCMSWDRIVMIMQFAVDLVTIMIETYSLGGFQRVFDLIGITESFFTTYVDHDIIFMGGWSKIVSSMTDLKEKDRYDIPDQLLSLSGFELSPRAPPTPVQPTAPGNVSSDPAYMKSLAEQKAIEDNLQKKTLQKNVGQQLDTGCSGAEGGVEYDTEGYDYYPDVEGAGSGAEYNPEGYYYYPDAEGAEGGEESNPDVNYYYPDAEGAEGDADCELQHYYYYPDAEGAEDGTEYDPQDYYYYPDEEGPVTEF